MRGFLLLILSGLIAASTGCAMCCAPYDQDYSAFGGIHERQDPRYGRVGSVFAPADGGAIVDGAVIEGDVGQEVIIEGDYGQSVLQGSIPHTAEAAPTPGASEYYEYGDF